MEELRSYLVRITAAAILCGIATALLGKTEAVGKLVKMIAGIFMTLVIMSPLVQIRWNDFLLYQENLELDAAYIASSGANSAKEAWLDGIKASTGTYILDKAKMLGADVTVEVMVSTSDPPIPNGVRISGTISPYGKTALSEWIARELGIAEEDQIWIG